MSCNHSQRTNCKIFNKPIIIDANFIINVVNSISEDVKRLRTYGEKERRFTELFRFYLGKFCNCPHQSQLLTSQLVMNNELNTRNRNSTICRKSPFLVDYQRNNRYANRFMSNMWTDLNARLKTISTSRDELNAIGEFLGANHHLSKEDLSLVVCAIKLSNPNGAVVVTADLNLENKIKSVIDNETIEMPQIGELSTLKILPMGIYTYISLVHDCCEMSNDANHRLFSYLVKKDIERLRDLSERVAKVKTSLITRYSEMHYKIVVRKANMANT